MENRQIQWKSDLINQAREGKWDPPLFILITWAFMMVMVAPIPGYLIGQGIENDLLRFVVGELTLAFAGMAAAVLLFVRFVEKRPIHTVGLTIDNALVKWGKGFSLGAGLFLLIAIISLVLGGYTLEFTGAKVGVAMLPAVLFTLIGWTVQGGTEELFTRGWLMPVLGKKYGIWVGILVNSVIFIFMHVFNPSVGFLPYVNLGLFAVFASILALWQGDIWLVCGLHTAWNFVQGSVLGISVSGMSTGNATLVRMVPEEVNWISGGAFGLEGSALTTLVLALATIWVLRNWTTNLYVAQRQNAWKKK